MRFKGNDREPTPEEAVIIEQTMSDEQKAKSAELEELYGSMNPPHFNQDSGSILFDLDRRLVLTDRLQPLVTEQGYEPKGDFHVTIFGFKNGRLIKEALNALPADQKASKLQEIQNLISETDWVLASTPKLYTVSKEYKGGKRETIVQTLDLKELKNFSHQLSEMLGIKLEPQFPHLTLFTRGDDLGSKMGIGIDTEEDFKKLNPQLLEI